MLISHVVESRILSLRSAIMMGVISLAGGVFSIAYAQSTTDIAANVTALIVAIGSVLGAISAIATSIVGMIRSKTADKIISNKAYNDVSLITQNLIATDYWIKENQTNMTNIVATIAANPDAKKLLEEKGVNIQALTNDLNGINDDLQRWHSMLPGYKSQNNP